MNIIQHRQSLTVCGASGRICCWTPAVQWQVKRIKATHVCTAWKLIGFVTNELIRLIYENRKYWDLSMWDFVPGSTFDTQNAWHFSITLSASAKVWNKYVSLFSAGPEWSVKIHVPFELAGTLQCYGNSSFSCTVWGCWNSYGTQRRKKWCIVMYWFASFNLCQKQQKSVKSSSVYSEAKR